MKNTLNLQIDTAAPCNIPQQSVETAHALDVDFLLVRIAQARQARATMAAALAQTQTQTLVTGLAALVPSPPTPAPIYETRTGTRPRKTAPCKMYSRGRCQAGDACDFLHDPDVLWTPQRNGAWCWRYLAGVCAGPCKFRHPCPEEMSSCTFAILCFSSLRGSRMTLLLVMKHTPCVIPSCPRTDCPRRHADVDFDPEFNQKQYSRQAPRLAGTISPRERAGYAAALRARLQTRTSLQVQLPFQDDRNFGSPTDSATSSGSDSVRTPATSRADLDDDWRARHSEGQAEFPHTPGATHTFAVAGEMNWKGHTRRQSVWVKGD